jgi:hypothetical protein
MTRLSRLRLFSLAGVCAVAIGAGGILLPATAFALPKDDPRPCNPWETAPGGSSGCSSDGSGGGYSGGAGMIPPATGPYERSNWDPRCVLVYDEELGRKRCEPGGPPPLP